MSSSEVQISNAGDSSLIGRGNFDTWKQKQFIKFIHSCFFLNNLLLKVGQSRYFKSGTLFIPNVKTSH